MSTLRRRRFCKNQVFMALSDSSQAASQFSSRDKKLRSSAPVFALLGFLIKLAVDLFNLELNPIDLQIPKYIKENLWWIHKTVLKTKLFIACGDSDKPREQIFKPRTLDIYMGKSHRN